RHEILLNVSDHSFHLSFCLRTTDTAYFRNHADCCGKVFEQWVPTGLPVISHAKYDCFHLVGQHRFGNTAKVLQCVDHAPEKAVDVTTFFKLYVHGAGVPKHHREHWNLSHCTVKIDVFTNLPVHLCLVSRFRFI